MSYQLILIPIALVIISQLIKFFLNLARGSFNLRNLIMNGGMPSSHSVFVTSFIILIGYNQGIQSPVFAVALIVTILAIHSAFRIRVHIGRNGKAINYLLRTLKKEHPKLKDVPEQTEITGHNPSEVFAGIVLGALGTIITILLI